MGRAEGDRALIAVDLQDWLLKCPASYTEASGITSFQKCWLSLPNKHVDILDKSRAKGNYKGGLGVAWSAGECLSVLQGREDVNYAVWRQDKDSTLHIFDMSER